MREIKKVAILGANGNMGSTSGGIFAQAGIKCHFFANTQEKASKGIENAVNQARSSVLIEHIQPHSYEDLEKIIPQCDWIFEALAENIDLKKQYFARLESIRKADSIVSTVSSGLSIEEMVSNCSESLQQHFLGTHFYNPPSKLIANELIYHSKNTDEFKKFVYEFCERVLYRKNIVTSNTAAFAGNRIGFQLLNHVAIYAEKIGIEEMDYLMGCYTGRALPPLATIDLVGLDVHKAIVDNIFNQTQDEAHDTHKMPAYMQAMVDKGMLGLKAQDKGGFFKRDAEKNKFALDPQTMSHKLVKRNKIAFIENIKQYLCDGQYKKAISLLLEERSSESYIIKTILLGYIAYSFYRIGEATPKESFIHGIDTVMSYGFSWLPPSGWVDLLGGPREVAILMEEHEIVVPTTLLEAKDIKGSLCTIPEISRFLIAR